MQKVTGLRSVDKLGLKIINSYRSNNNIVMEIDSPSESYAESSQAEPTTGKVV